MEINEEYKMLSDYDLTELGIGESLEGALCYVFGPVTGLLFLVMEQRNTFVRFHALQSIIASVVFIVINIFLTGMSTIPFMGWIMLIISSLISFIGVLVWIFLILKAYRHERFRLPIIGDIAEKNVNMRI